MDENKNRKIIFVENKTVVAGYTIFEYYPNGNTQHITNIHKGKFENKQGEFNKDKPDYYYHTRDFEDKAERPKSLNEQHIINNDPSHLYWLDNILSD